MGNRVSPQIVFKRQRCAMSRHHQPSSLDSMPGFGLSTGPACNPHSSSAGQRTAAKPKGGGFAHMDTQESIHATPVRQAGRTTRDGTHLYLREESVASNHRQPRRGASGGMAAHELDHKFERDFASEASVCPPPSVKRVQSVQGSQLATHYSDTGTGSSRNRSTSNWGLSLRPWTSGHKAQGLRQAQMHREESDPESFIADAANSKPNHIRTLLMSRPRSPVRPKSGLNADTVSSAARRASATEALVSAGKQMAFTPKPSNQTQSKTQSNTQSNTQSQSQSQSRAVVVPPRDLTDSGGPAPFLVQIKVRDGTTYSEPKAALCRKTDTLAVLKGTIHALTGVPAAYQTLWLEKHRQKLDPRVLSSDTPLHHGDQLVKLEPENARSSFSSSTLEHLSIHAGSKVVVEKDGDSMALNLNDKLLGAVLAGDAATVREMIKENSSLDITSEPLGSQCSHIAAKNGHANVITLLMAHGCSRDTPDQQGNTALHAAVASLPRMHGGLQVVSLLLTSAADPLLANDNGKTPFHLAVAMDALDDSLAVAVLKTVIQRCVNVCIEDMTGVATLQYAVATDKHQCIELLEQQMGVSSTSKKETVAKEPEAVQSSQIQRSIVEQFLDGSVSQVKRQSVPSPMVVASPSYTLLPPQQPQQYCSPLSPDSPGSFT